MGRCPNELREDLSFELPWEQNYGYVQAVRVRDTIYIAGQVSHDLEGNLVAPAPVGSSGQIIDASNTEAQMRAAYANAETLLRRFGATMADVVEETIYALDVDAAFEAAGKVRKAAYGTDRPRCASTLVGTTRLAFRELLVEISLTAVMTR